MDSIRPRTLIHDVPAPSKGKLPPELAKETDRSLVAHYFAGVELAEQVVPKDTAMEVVNTAFVQLCDTHRWDPMRGTLRTHFLVLVKNELHAFRHSMSEKVRDTQARAYDGYYREIQSPYTASPEEVLLARGAEEEWEAGAAERQAKAKRMVAKLQDGIAHHLLAKQLLAYYYEIASEDPPREDEPLPRKEKLERDRRLKPRILAARFGVTVRELHSAKKILERKAWAIRAEEEGEGK